jgi:hypothetical protein
MTDILNGLYNLLSFIEENWGMIAAIIVMVVSISKKIVAFMAKSREEKIEIAKTQISQTMLKWVTIAECDWLEWQQAGEIKRSQVIDMIFEKYPILSQVANQQEIIAWLDDMIDEALKTMRKIFEENANHKAEEGSNEG